MKFKDFKEKIQTGIVVEAVSEAITYIPFERKLALISIAVDGIHSDDGESISSSLISLDENGIAFEITGMKEMFLTRIFFVEYINVEFEDSVFTSDDYDYIISRGITKRVIEQVNHSKPNRKSDLEVHSVEDDFRSFEKLLNKEIYSTLSVLNNPANKIEQMLHELPNEIVDALLLRINMETGSEAIKDGLSELKSLNKEIFNFKKKKKK